MKQKDRALLKEIFSQVSKLTYSELKFQFKKEYEEKLKIDIEYSNDLNIEGRLEREEYITNLDASQLKSFKSVVKSIKDNYLFTEDDIDRLNNFTSRLNYLLKSTSPHNKGMADQMNNIKHGTRIDSNAPTFTLKSNSNDLTNGNSKSSELEIYTFFNDCIKSSTWHEYKSISKVDSSFFDKSFEWKLVYVFSNIKNCQDKVNYPLYYAAWQVTADWCFDIEYGNYDAFCSYYRNIDFLDDPKLLHFSCYYYLLRLAVRNDKSYQEFLDSKEEKEKQNIIKELRENEDDELNINEETNDNQYEMASNKNFFILAINQLSRIFSIAQAGKEFDFTLSTSESSLSDSTISKDDLLFVSVDDKVYYQFKVIDKTEEEIRLKKVFEIEKTIGYNVDEEGIIIKINKNESDYICSKLFDHLVRETSPSSEIQNNPKVYVEEKYAGRFVFQVLIYLNELDSLDRIKPYFKINPDPIYTSIKTDDISLTSIFKTSEKKLSKDELTFNDGKPRFFEDVLFNWENKYFYLSTEWTSGKDSRLDLDNFNTLIEKYYPEYSIYENKGTYFFTDKIPTIRKIDQVNFDISSFQEACKNSGLIFSQQIIQRFVASLWTKPFVICSGLSGSGKTKLAQAFVQWISENGKQYKIIPVGADWTNREPLLGYPNGLDSKSYVTPDSGALQLILEASKEGNQSKPYFMILDEMNLSHVERYFADFLSIMESKEKLKLYSGDKRFTQYTKKNEFDEEYFVPFEIEWPKNLFIIGTVNIDETTYMFSPKVLDRANVIEFRITPKEMDKFFKERKELNMKELFLDKDTSKGGAGQNMAKNFFQFAEVKTITKIPEKEGNVLNEFFNELQIVGSEFGYRSATEIELLITKLGINGFVDERGNSLSNSAKIDIAIMQKLLPKLHGSRKKLVGPLETLAGFCLVRIKGSQPDDQNKNKTLYQQFISEKRDPAKWEIKYSISFEKIERMLKNVIENGFTSYAEA
jgi:5-methylcytosine-specific restriction protein B